METRKHPRLELPGRRAMLLNLGLCISLLLVITAFEWETPVDDSNRITWQDIEDYTPIDEILPERKPEIKQPPKPKDISKVEAAEPEAEKTEEQNFEEPNEPEVTEKTGESINIGDAPPEDNPEYFFNAETMPVPEGGLLAFYKFVEKNLKYPRKAVNAGIEGIVYIKFIVNEKGEPTQFEIVRGIGFGCDEEALRVLKMYKWQPGK
ncbi:MAG TPA: TonB family protein, partial [Cyclobacteriaceae bacterium]|nr:TonB family protein [Cyclobacteriaceae bacterium]